MDLIDAALALFFFLIAFLYAAVGSGGGSGYLASMGIVGVQPEIMRPVALLLNVLVTSISTWKFVRAGHFSNRIFWPIAFTSVPAAFIGGRLEIAAAIYRPIVGIVLIFAAWRMWRSTQIQSNQPTSNKQITHTWLFLLIGALLGLVSGLLGIGGGIFLGPLLILSGWATTRETIGVSAAFVLINSLSGLLGRLTVMPSLPTALWLWLPAVAVGGYLGAEFAAHRFDHKVIRRILAVVLVFGGIRLIF